MPRPTGQSLPPSLFGDDTKQVAPTPPVTVKGKSSKSTKEAKPLKAKQPSKRKPRASKRSKAMQGVDSYGLFTEDCPPVVNNSKMWISLKEEFAQRLLVLCSQGVCEYLWQTKSQCLLCDRGNSPSVAYHVINQHGSWNIADLLYHYVSDHNIGVPLKLWSFVVTSTKKSHPLSDVEKDALSSI